MIEQGMQRRGSIAIAIAGVCLALVVPAAQARLARQPLTTGFGDGLFSSTDASVRARSLAQAQEAGAGILRINASWAGTAPATPSPSFNPYDPADPEYRWGRVDAAVRDATAQGFRVMVTATGAPTWAEGPGRPGSARHGTWRPDPGQFAAFGSALAKRYSGAFPDPERPGQALPAVHAFQAWNEPNLSTYLTPQWDGNTPTSPELYRGLLNAFYAGVKGVQPEATVVMGGTAPYGDPPGGQRVPPFTFDRVLFCADGGSCPEPARFDVFAHHPINVGSPLQGAASNLDATTPDVARLEQTLLNGLRAGGVAPPSPKPIWVTEIWWDSNPPDPKGVPGRLQARWISEAMNILWRQGASVVIFLQVADSLPVPNYQTTFQSGVFFADGRPKASLKAFRFPFVARRVGHKQVQVWGLPPGKGKVRIQRRLSHGWRTVARIRGSHVAPFVQTLPLRGHPKLRARSRSGNSFPYKTI